MGMIVRQSGPSLHRKAVVFCCDSKHVGLACFVANQINEAEPNRQFDICICSFDNNFESLVAPGIGLRLVQIDPQPFEELPSDPWIPLVAYIRIALPNIFQLDYDQIVYLDTDVFLRKGSVSQLFDAANPGFAVSAVLDSPQWTVGPKGFFETYWENLGLNGVQYFNSGVIVFNVRKYFEEEIFDRALQFSRNKTPYLLFHDQSVLNGHLKGRWYPLSLRWNWQMTQPEAWWLVPKMDPYILHFTGNTKPFWRNAVPFSKPYRLCYEHFFKVKYGRPPPDKSESISQPEENGTSHIKNAFLTPEVLHLIKIASHPLRRTLLRIRLLKEVLCVERRISEGTALWPRT